MTDSLRHRIYLDNAATSWPKPECVYQAIDAYQRHVGAAYGRGAYREATLASQTVEAARRRIAELVGAGRDDQVVFTLNGTDSLNMAIHGLLADATREMPAHVVTTVVEHNSVLRPIHALTQAARVRAEYVDCDSNEKVDVEAARRAIRRDTRLVVVAHASNVTGAIQPVADLARIAHEAGALVLVDAAQTLGEIPLDLEALGADVVAAPGHKGLLGPLGTGVLIIRAAAAERIQPLRQGGTGSQSQLDQQPSELPDRLESGNLNVPGIAGLAAGVEWLSTRGLHEIRRHAEALNARLLDGLRRIERIVVHGPPSADDRACIVSVSIPGYEPQEVAALLDSVYGVQVRAGLHCAPRMHAALGTLDAGGTVRLSHGPFTTADDIDAAIAAIGEMAQSAV